VWAGFVAGVLAACVFWFFRALGLTRLSPSGQLGCLFYDDPRLPMVETLGFVLLLVLDATLLAAIFAALLRATGGPGWGRGAAFGGLCGLALAAALPWFARASRCVRMGRLPSPGHLGLEWGRATPVSLVAGFAVYGAVFGAVLRSLSTRAPW
jgi:hypothetical protein